MKILSKIAVALIATMTILPFANAQQGDMIYFLPNIPSANHLNPALVNSCRWHIGFPGLSALSTGVVHSGFNLDNFVKQRADDSIYFDTENALSHMGKLNYIATGLEEEIFSLGFKISENHYISASLAAKVAFRFSYPREFMELLTYGNARFIGDVADLEHFEVNATSYVEYSLGYAGKLFEGWTIGTRFKYLEGAANIDTRRSLNSLYTEETNYELTANTDYLLNISVPEAVYYDTIEDFDHKQFLPFKNKNSGIGFDLGAVYEMNDKVTLSASVIDLGFITWRNGTHNFKNSTDDVTFTGLDIDGYFNQPDSVIEEKFENLADSLSERLEYTESSDKYTTMLNTKIYVGANYKLFEHGKSHMLLKNEFYSGQWHPSLILGFSHKLGRVFEYMVTYSMKNRSYNNLGLGFLLKLGPFQWHLATDNALAPLLPEYAKNVNFQTGINFVFGCRKKARKSIPFMGDFL